MTDGLVQLAAFIADHCKKPGVHKTLIPSLYLTNSTATGSSRQTVDRAILCVVAQGAKSIVLNERAYRFGAGQSLVIPLDLPLVGQITKASEAWPCLSLIVELDIAELTSLITEADMTAPVSLPEKQAFAIQKIDDELLDVLLRFMRLLSSPAQIPILAPLLLRELHYRLLLSRGSSMVRRVAGEKNQMRRIAACLAFLKRNMTRTVRMSELAREVHMSPTRMHQTFKAATGMTPGQFQKSLRLQEGRRVMIFENLDVNTASWRVGYRSASQFSRDYSRHFGAPPLRDVRGILASKHFEV